MNTRGGNVSTTTPRHTRHTRALPTAAGRQQWKGTMPTQGPSKNRSGAEADGGRHTATHTRREPHASGPLMGRRHGTPGTASSHQRLRERP